jgi:hypothetical protein
LYSRKQADDLARVHIEIQHFQRPWDPLTGLRRGTIFPVLYRPYNPKQHPLIPPDNGEYRGREAKVRGGRDYE